MDEAGKDLFGTARIVEEVLRCRQVDFNYAIRVDVLGGA
jgi:hypothetical protein